jgi:hypothetical protein
MLLLITILLILLVWAFGGIDFWTAEYRELAFVLLGIAAFLQLTFRARVRGR